MWFTHCTTPMSLKDTIQKSNLINKPKFKQMWNRCLEFALWYKKKTHFSSISTHEFPVWRVEIVSTQHVRYHWKSLTGWRKEHQHHVQILCMTGFRLKFKSKISRSAIITTSSCGVRFQVMEVLGLAGMQSQEIRIILLQVEMNSVDSRARGVYNHTGETEPRQIVQSWFLACFWHHNVSLQKHKICMHEGHYIKVNQIYTVCAL